jgi:catechol 2,3-dioxygenase-like lactoylglutathione lyase family enzyme
MYLKYAESNAMPRNKKKQRTTTKSQANTRKKKKANSINRQTPYVASVPVVVSDREASKKWYIEKLGLALVDDNDHWVTVGGARGKGSVLHLCQASENQPEPIPLEPGPSGIVILLPGDFRKACERLEAAGVEFSQRPEKAPWGWYATIKDPDGNEHHLGPAS